ncbi:hypothetical protein HAX54_017500 [Datura stramonium]|uniref:Rx N-terminal domain-containing protein n=1 Tax=Datura stramonium TaxID=4076 RepID=A0ABS8S0F6_DATST|nr:hypothetical protein [Datura stramonium]
MLVIPNSSMIILVCKLLLTLNKRFTKMEIGLAVGGAFLSSALNVLFDRLAPQGELLMMFHQKDKHDVRLLKKLRMTLLGLQAVLSDAENKQASNPYISQWLNELQDALDIAENLIEEVNYEVLRLKVEVQHQNLAETSNKEVSDLNLCLSDDFFINTKQKLEGTIGTLVELEKQIGHLNLTKYLDLGKQETRKSSTSVVDESDIFGNQYFLELRSRSLFERVRESSKWNPEEFLMHDLVNDLAQIASSNLCIRKEDDAYILPRLTSLRALSLSHYMITELPNDLFIALKLLRFLDLSWTTIRKLPYSICALYNLETLLLSSCGCLEELPLQIEKLINLRHLDISGTSLLEMPLQTCKLKSLHVLVGAKFILTGCSGSRMEDLGELHNLYGSLSILELQNVVDRREALKAKMREKEHVKMLSLTWRENIADNSPTERDILDELQPNTNIKEVRITGYRGKKFPNWLADHLFLKLVQLSLCMCKDCDSLPALGQLSSLKFLSIRGMHQITEVIKEFYGSSSSKKPFNSLEKLEFAEMPEWKQWHVLGNGEFPALQELRIYDCPKLIGELPENLCSLTGLTISECPELNLETPVQLSNLKEFKVVGSPQVGVLFDQVELFPSQLQGMKQIVELYIDDCQSLTSLPISILPSTLKRISIGRTCGRLKLEASVGEMISRENCNMFLEKLDLEGWDSIDDISPELVPGARYLSVRSCCNLTRLCIPTGTESLDISRCENFEILYVVCGTQMMSLGDFELKLLECPEIESFPEGGLPFNLQVLKIINCEKLVNCRKEWHLQRLPCLRELWIRHDGSDEEILTDEDWELPCSIRKLSISNLKTLSSKLLKSLTSIEYLAIGNSPQIQSLLEEGLPSSLSELYLSVHPELHSLPMEGLRHLTSVRNLEISSCYQLQSIQALPSSLSVLSVWNCPNLQSLPVKGILSSLSKLYISLCPLLELLLEFDKGKYWPNIAHIPTIESHGEYLIMTRLNDYLGREKVSKVSSDATIVTAKKAVGTSPFSKGISMSGKLEELLPH